MSFQLVPKLVTLNDLVCRNGPYFALFHRVNLRSNTSTSMCIDQISPSVTHRMVKFLCVTKFKDFSVTYLSSFALPLASSCDEERRPVAKFMR